MHWGRRAATPRRRFHTQMAGLWEITRYFLKLGTLGFGGPNAHIAAMHEDLVRKRRWLSERHFLDVVGVTNLIPGPNSSEIAVHLGYVRAGPVGGLAAGLSFLVPAFLMMLALSWAYFRGSEFALRDDILAGVQPVALAAIVATLWRLRSAVLGGWVKPVLAVAGLGLTLAVPRFSPLVLLGAGMAGLLARRGTRETAGVAAIPAAVGAVIGAGGGLPALAWVFLRTGLLLFGGGLVLVPLLAPEVVARGWLTESQFLDGIALGQATPGPVVLASVFVGYAVEGVLGAIVATAAIYLPSFLAVLAGTGPFLRRLRGRSSVAAFVEGVTAAAIGAILAAAVLLAPEGLSDVFRVGVFVVAAVAILLRAPIVLVVTGGAAVGAAAGALGFI
jgi:chromate transporter